MESVQVERFYLGCLAPASYAVCRRTGPVEIRSRAADMASRSQPETPEWNRLGYGNNAIQKTRFQVR
jgi:hypothetical protein